MPHGAEPCLAAVQDAHAIEDVSDPFWLPCQRNGVRRGRLQVQVQFVQNVQSRPLRILLLTWNMANAAPPANFPSCFPGAASCVPAPCRRFAAHNPS